MKRHPMTTRKHAMSRGHACPTCGSGNINIFDIEGERSYACRDCGATWR